MLEFYGVNHGGHSVDDGVVEGTISITPSVELIGILETLPPGKKVGIEYHPSLGEPRNVDGIIFSQQSPALQYWRNIEDAIKRSSSSVVHLEDTDVQERYARAFLNQIKAARGLQEYCEGSEWDPLVFRDLAEAKYSASSLSDYIFVIERENAILDRIQATRPDIAILGDAHIRFLLSGGKEELDKRGINVIGYHREEVARKGFSFLELLNGAAKIEEEGKLVQNAESDPRSVLERQHIVRKFNSAIKGRVVPEAQPQFIGTWDIRCRPRGLFEVYIDGDNFSGTIEDNFGTALFEGEVSKKDLRFVKQYDPNSSAGTSEEILSFKPVEYEAISDDGQTYIGEFYNSQIGGGEFIIYRGDSFPT